MSASSLSVAWLAAASPPGTVLVSILLAIAWLLACLAIALLGYLVLALPLWRIERARLFLDLLASGLQQGRRPEATLVDAARSGDPALSSDWFTLASVLETGVPLRAALDVVPGLIPPRVAGALRAGAETGDLARVLPACQAMLRDGPSQTRHLLNYLVLLITAFTPVGGVVLGGFAVFVLPKFRMMASDLTSETMAVNLSPLLEGAIAFGIGMAVVSAIILVALLLRTFGPRSRGLFNAAGLLLADRLTFLIPWQRRRLYRDFVGTLGVLLDAGLPEARCLELAADGTANEILRRRARHAVTDLQQGRSLPEAIAHLDSSGELRWRLANAAHGNRRFETALAGWRETLDSKAFQQEQASAHLATTGLILAHGTLVGLVVLSVFQVLVDLIDAATLW